MAGITGFISNHWIEILAAVAALVGGGIVWRWISHRQSGSSSYSDQSGSIAGGDIVGRDKITSRSED